MGNIYDYEVLEGGTATEEEYFVALQESINGAVAWQFQGSVGRTMMEAIEGGFCLLGKSGAYDYWGNYIPSRDEVKDGTKGSYGYVAKARGSEWADRMAAL